MIFAKVKDFKFHKFAKIQIFTKSPNFVKKILNITNFVGSRFAKSGGPFATKKRHKPNRVLRIFFKILVMRANFGDLGILVSIDFKILKKVCHVCYPILGQILENFDFRILVKSQSYDKPPWRNFGFLSNFVEIEIILDFRVKDFKFCDFRVKDFKFRDITNFVNFGKIFFKFVTKIIKIQKN